MKVLTHRQVIVLGDLITGRIPVLEMNANTAASLMTKGAIIYHSERDGSLSYRKTREADALLKQQARLDKAPSFATVRKEVTDRKKVIRSAAPKRRSKAKKKRVGRAA